jgi:hypothetical protein
LRKLSIRDILTFYISGQKQLVLFTLNKDGCSIGNKKTRVLGRKLPSYLFKGFTIVPQFIEPEKYLIRSNMKLSTYSSIRSLSIKIEVVKFLVEIFLVALIFFSRYPDS